MRQEHFVARHRASWDAFERWLSARGEKPRGGRERLLADSLRDEDVPGLYRRICHHLALARRRGYSPQVTARLQDLMQRGHNALYRSAPVRWYAALAFLGGGFPRLVRAEWKCMLASLLLFAVPLLTVFFLLQSRPELAHSLFSPQQLAEVERMYDPAESTWRIGRDSGTDVAMFGHYIFNNVSIGFRTFASGLLAGIGSAFVLLMNGVIIGGVAGHLHQIGYGSTFWRFVAGHAPFELTAIVIAGGAGLRLGLNLLAPGNRRRVDALIEAGRRGGLLCLGVLAMLVVAAFIEAFWSSIGSIPASVKFAVSGALWTVVTVWLWRGGRSGTDAA